MADEAPAEPAGVGEAPTAAAANKWGSIALSGQGAWPKFWVVHIDGSEGKMGATPGYKARLQLQGGGTKMTSDIAATPTAAIEALLSGEAAAQAGLEVLDSGAVSEQLAALFACPVALASTQQQLLLVRAEAHAAAADRAVALGRV